MAEGFVLDVCVGTKDGATLSVRAATPLESVTREDGVVRGKLTRWARVLVRTTGVGGSTRVWVIEPGDAPNEIRFGDLHVRGRFAIVDQSNNARKVEQIWKRTPPAG
jgi:hypothetical protein